MICRWSPMVFFSVAGGVQVLIAIINYAMNPDCKDARRQLGGARRRGLLPVLSGAVMPMLVGFQSILYQLYTPWHRCAATGTATASSA